VDNGDGTWSLAIPAADALVEAFYDVTVTVTDVASNTTSDGTTDELEIDLTDPLAPIPVLTADANNDALLSVAEAVNPQPVDITLPAGAVAGDVLTLDDGTTTVDFVLTAADIAAGVVSTSVALPADGSTLTVTAHITDQAGNVSPSAMDSAVVDVTLPLAPTVTILEDADNDGFINLSELVGPVDVQVTLPASAAAGDVLTIVLDGVTTMQTLTNADITAGIVSTTTATPANGATVQADVSLTTSSDTAVVDIQAPAVPTVTSLTTNTGTPVISGTATVGPNEVLSVAVNGIVYIAGDGNLVDNGDGTWSLTIPAADSLLATQAVTYRLIPVPMNSLSIWSHLLCRQRIRY